jgi:hypothetical protein
MNELIRPTLVIEDTSAPSEGDRSARQRTIVSVDKVTLNHALERSGTADLQHVIGIVMRVLANYPLELRSTIDAYADAIAMAKTTGETAELTFSRSPEGEIEATPKLAGSPALRRALARGRNRVAEILEGPGMLAGRDFAAMLGISAQTLNQWRAQRKVLALSGAKRGFRYPDWQLVDAPGVLLPGLVQLHSALEDQPWAVYRFLRQHHIALDGRTGIESLKSGDIDATVAAAKGISDTFN